MASQCLTLAAKNGVEDADVLRMLQTFHSSPIPTGYAQRMSEGDYSTEVTRAEGGVWLCTHLGCEEEERPQ